MRKLNHTLHTVVLASFALGGLSYKVFSAPYEDPWQRSVSKDRVGGSKAPRSKRKKR